MSGREQSDQSSELASTEANGTDQDSKTMDKESEDKGAVKSRVVTRSQSENDGVTIDHFGQRNQLTLADLSIIIDKLWDARAKWKEIGIGLKVDHHTLEVIEQDCLGIIDKCFTQLLSTWLKGTRTSLKPEKSVIVKVLRTTFVNCDSVADNFLFDCPCGENCRVQSFLLGKDCRTLNSPHVQSPPSECVDIMHRFNRLTASVQASIASYSTIALINVVNKIGIYDKACCQLEKRHNLSDIIGLRNTMSVTAAFGVIQNHILSFFNFEVLQAVIKELCQSDSSIKEHMESYKKEFKKFCKHKVAEIPSDIYAESMGRRNVRMIVVSTAQQSTDLLLSYVCAAKEKMAEKLGLSTSTMCLHRVSVHVIKGMTLVFAIPEQLADSLPFTFPRKRFKLGELSVRALMCGMDENKHGSYDRSSPSSSTEVPVHSDARQLRGDILRLEKLRKEVEDRIKYLEELTDRFKMLKEQEKMLTNRLTIEKNNLKKFKSNLEDMNVLSTEEKQHITECIEKVEETIESLEQQLNDGKAERADVYGKMIELKNELDESHFHFEELVQRLKGKTAKIRQQRDSKTMAVQSVLKDTKASELVIEIFQGILEESEQEFQGTFEERIKKEIENKIKAGLVRVIAISEQITAAKDVIDQAQTAIIEADEKCQKLEEKIANVKEKISQAHDKLEELNKECEATETRFSEAESQLKIENEKLQEIDKVTAEIQASIESESFTGAAPSDSGIAQKVTRLNDKRKKLLEKIQDFIKASETVERYEKCTNEAKKELNKAKEKSRDETKVIKNEEEICRDLVLESVNHSQQSTATKSRLEETVNNVSTLRESLKIAVDDVNDNLKDLHSYFERLIARLNDKIKETSEVIKVIKAKVEAMAALKLSEVSMQ